jgi:hypothetical protein
MVWPLHSDSGKGGHWHNLDAPRRRQAGPIRLKGTEPNAIVDRLYPQTRRSRVSSVPPVEADAPNMLWANDFQFDSTTSGKAVKIASMIDEHTRARC